MSLRRVLTGAATSGFKKTRIPIRKFKLDQPAELTLSVENLMPEVKTEDCALVLTRPYGVALPLYIFMIVVGGLLFIGGKPFTIFWLSGEY